MKMLFICSKTWYSNSSEPPLAVRINCRTHPGNESFTGSRFTDREPGLLSLYEIGDNWMTTNIRRHLSGILVAGVICLGFVSAAQATPFIAPEDYSMFTRGDAGTTYQYWDVFTSTSGATADIANNNSNGDATVSEVNGVSMATGSGNIYAMGGNPSFEIVIPEFDAPGHFTSVLLQITTLGSEFIPGSVKINGADPGYSVEFGRVTIPAGPSTADQVDTLFTWNGLTSSDTITIEFDGAMHMSLTQVAVDTNTVPEPGTAVLMLIGLTGLACRKNRKA